MWKGSYIRSSVQPGFGETTFQVTFDSTKLEVSESSCVVQTERASHSMKEHCGENVFQRSLSLSQKCWKPHAGIDGESDVVRQYWEETIFQLASCFTENCLKTYARPTKCTRVNCVKEHSGENHLLTNSSFRSVGSV